MLKYCNILCLLGLLILPLHSALAETIKTNDIILKIVTLAGEEEDTATKDYPDEDTMEMELSYQSKEGDGDVIVSTLNGLNRDPREWKYPGIEEGTFNIENLTVILEGKTYPCKHYKWLDYETDRKKVTIIAGLRLEVSKEEMCSVEFKYQYSDE